MFMVLSALVLAVGLVVGGLYVQAGDKGEQASTPASAPAPSTPRRRVDTGAAPPPVAAPPPKRTSRPKSTPRPAAAPKAAPAPPPPPTSGPQPVTIKLQGSLPYSSVEIARSRPTFRPRGSFAGGTATVAGVPTGADCQAKFKGGPPASKPIRAGQTLSCSSGTGGQLICN